MQLFYFIFLIKDLLKIFMINSRNMIYNIYIMKVFLIYKKIYLLFIYYYK